MFLQYKSVPALLVVILLVLGSVSCTPRCPIASCQTRMIHPHGGQDYRGMPWYKKQRPRIGEKLPKPSKEVQREMNKNGGR
ncbi:hypothetical protein [Rufibacter roseus]